MVGQSISHYLIVSELGRGRMGIAYNAEDSNFNRPHARKVLLPKSVAGEAEHARFLFRFILLLLVVLGTSRLAVAQVQKLTAADGAAQDHFGESVSISGDLAIIGAPTDDDRGIDSGSAYVFRRISGIWIEKAKLTASDGAVGDGFGGSVSISGDLAIVGAPGDDDNGDESGSAYIFRRNAGVWIEEQKLLAPDGEPFDIFGHSVSISGDLAVIGENCSNGSSCSAYIYRRDAGLWTQEAKLTASDGWVGDWFAFCVSISGDLAIVGAPGDDDSGDYTGSAYIYRRDAGLWTEEAKLTASDGAANDWFGWSVSISGDLAIVGLPLWGESAPEGSAYIYRRDAGLWTEEAKLTASDGAAGDYFGSSVSISGDLAIIGARFDDDNGDKSGSAYVYRRIGGIWIEEAKLKAPDGAAGDYFGGSVSISGDLAIVGTDWSEAVYVNTLSPFLSTEPFGDEIPSHYLLQQNYPNPFNPRTTISFSLPSSEHVTIEVHDVFGKTVRNLLSRSLPFGKHAVELDAHNLASGIYFYTLTAGSFQETKSMVLLK